MELVRSLSEEDATCAGLASTGALQGVLDLLMRSLLTAPPGQETVAGPQFALASSFLQNLVRHDPETLALFRDHPAVAGRRWQAWAGADERRKRSDTAFGFGKYLDTLDIPADF